jgi:hypothetical protein
MYDALLGMLLGAGIVLAFQELRNQINAYKVRRWHRRAAETIALLDECECWDDNATGVHAYYCPMAEMPEPKRFRSIVHP